MNTFHDINKKLLKLYPLFILLLFISFSNISGCGSSGNSNIIGPGGGTVTSKDGRLKLIFPPGAVDENVEIIIENIGLPELPMEFDELDPTTNYDLQPDGLKFNVPITVELLTDQETLDQDGNISVDGALLFISSNGVFELLSNLENIINADENTVLVKGSLEHFSDLVEIKNGVLTKIENVPEVIGINIPFKVDVDIRRKERFKGPGVCDFFYTDSSLADIFPLSETELIMEVIPTFIPDLIIGGLGTHKASFDYICSSSQATDGTFGAQIDNVINLTGFCDVEYKQTFAQFIDCPAESPPPPTPPLPEFNLEDILGNWDANCNQNTDPFGIILGNLGSPFNLQLVITIDPLTGQLSSMINIVALPDLFELDGTINEAPEGQKSDLSILQNGNSGSFIANAEGSGFLGDSNPTAANIITKAENWIFTTDEEGNPILQEGVLRFNFPTLPNNGDSSLADCTGVKSE
ncbi:MAG: hypothetical protein ACR2NW_08845 [Thermodesulfobacteriota bacterium]